MERERDAEGKEREGEKERVKEWFMYKIIYREMGPRLQGATFWFTFRVFYFRRLLLGALLAEPVPSAAPFGAQRALAACSTVLSQSHLFDSTAQQRRGCAARAGDEGWPLHVHCG